MNTTIENADNKRHMCGKWAKRPETCVRHPQAQRHGVRADHVQEMSCAEKLIY